MIEEAAGTRMYECKKLSAQKTIEKKEAKLNEIHTVLFKLFQFWHIKNIFQRRKHANTGVFFCLSVSLYFLF